MSDIGKIEGRVLAQQDHVECGKLGVPRLAERKVAPGLVADLERAHRGGHLGAAQHKPVGRVIVEGVPSALRFENKAKVESPRTLIRSIGSICTATFKGIGRSGLARMWASVRLEAKVYAILAATATMLGGIQRVASKALVNVRGIRPGATRITSNGCRARRRPDAAQARPAPPR